MKQSGRFPDAILISRDANRTIRFTFGLIILMGIGACGTAGSDTSYEEYLEARRKAVHPLASTMLTQADRMLQAGNFSLALAYTDSARRYAPEMSAVPFQQGILYMHLRQYDEARTMFEETLELDPYFVSAWFNIGSINFRQGKFRDAVAALKAELELLETMPKNIGDIFDYSDGVARSASYLTLGRVYREMNEFEQAREAFLKAARVQSDNAEAYFQLARLHEAEGEYDNALPYVARATDADPSNVEYRHLQGSLLARVGRPADALGILKEVVEEDPAHRGAHHSLGQALLHLGRRDEAQVYLARADSLQRLLADLSVAEVSVEQYPTHVPQWFEYGVLLRAAGRLDDALKAFGTALSLEPDNHDLQEVWADVQFEKGNLEAAGRRYHAIVQENPARGETWFKLGVVSYRSGDMDSARQFMETALELIPDHEYARQYLAMM